jgi:RimJ/RimL family protein N-acetyltransferase
MMMVAETQQQRMLLLAWLIRHIHEQTGVALTPETTVGPYRFEIAGFFKDDNQIVGVVVLTQFRDGDAEATYAGVPGWITRTHLRDCFAWFHGGLGLRRTTALVARKRKHERRLCERLGYTLEGVKRQASPTEGDAFCYGLLASECKWRA